MAEQNQGQQPDVSALTSSFFPPPPAYYQHFTDANLARFASLGGPSGTSKNRARSDDQQNQEDHAGLSTEEVRELSELRAKLEPPRADWVAEEGRWKCFGEVYTTDLAIPSAEDIGLPPWVDPNAPPQKSLPPILHSFLHTLLLLLDALTNTALTPMELAERGIQHVGDPYIQHLSNLAATMMVASNQLRGAQAEATLVMLMEKQVDARRAQTVALRKKCRSIASSVQRLRQAASATTADGASAVEVDAKSPAREDGSPS